MRSRLIQIATTGLVTAALLAATASAGGLPRRYSADAFFTTTSGCVHTFVGIFPVGAKEVGAGQVEGASMSMQLEQFDVCTNTFLLRAAPQVGVVFLAPGEFEMSAGLNKASLHLSVTLQDSLSGRVFPVTIDLTYDRVGPRSDCSEQAGGGEVTTFCSAVAEGVVSDGTTNYAPEPGNAVFQEHRPA